VTEKKLKNLSKPERKKLKNNLKIKKETLEKIIIKERYQEFEKKVFPRIFYEDIKKTLQPNGWETDEIKHYFDYMNVLKKESEIKKFETKKRNRSYTRDQIDRIKTLKENKKGKTFDRSGKVIDKVKVFRGGSPGLGKKK